MDGTIPLRQVLTTLGLPPLGLVIACVAAGLLAWRGSRAAGLGAAVAAAVILLLATPAVSALLMASLEREVDLPAPPPRAAPAAIIVLGAEVTHGRHGAAVGPLTLERLRAGAALQRRTGLPLLVTGGVLSPGDPPLAALMARSLEEDFRTPARWVEPRAADTRDNAVFSAAMLRAEGIGAAFVVSHAWHLPRALEAFGRAGLEVVPEAPDRVPDPRFDLPHWLPRVDRLVESWFALREWAGRLVYAIRDGN
ncbi:YdcF family protein [Roseomonas populi]|uniref:YdcF family protein n=1 Tax=Roseomonas populi TaxID=3121582 RepID=A0ABT1XAJ4_9PROT|nr:YdcF family protein [Roseomonas pecuniae]MCR0985121.1 YdcF family protein [Roseomonas pecuniae]